MDRPTAAHAPRSRVARRIALAIVALGAGAAALLAPEDRPARAASPLTINVPIAIDGSFADWDAVLANPLQTTRDGDGSSAAIKANCALYSTDRDCPQPGGAGNDFLTFAWTYDATNVYLYVERYGSTANGVDFLFVADVNRDKRLTLLNGDGTPSADVIVHANWFGGTGNVDLRLWSYDPADDINGDPLVCTPVAPATSCANAAGLLTAPAGYVDGYKLPGVNVSRRACTGCSGRGGADGLRVELAIPWTAFGTTLQGPFFWHTVSSNNDSLASTVDNIGAPSGGLGTFVQRGVSLSPDRSGSVLSPGQVTYVHTLKNDGNDQDFFDLVATSSQGAQVEVLEAGVVIGTDATGDGTWDSIRAGRDQNGDGKPDVTLSAGESRDLSVRITMPSGRTGQDVTRLTATSGNQATVSATVTDTSHVGTAAFVPVSHAAYTVAAQPVPFRESLVNGQVVSDTFALRADAGCAGDRLELAADAAGNPGAVFAIDATGDGTWDWVGSDTDGDGQPDLGPVGASSSKAFHLVVTPPGGTAAGTACTVALTATSPVTGASASASHAVTVAPSVSFAPDYRGASSGVADVSDTQIPSGGGVFFPAVIRNAEATARSYALVQTQTGAGAAAPRVWSDPDGDGNPSDGALITQTAVLSAFGGSQHVVVEVRAGTATNGTFVVTTTTATALSGGASASQVSESVVGYLAVFADALHADASNVFAPCATVYVEARGLLAGNVGTYALAWAPPSGPAPAGVSPWPTTARGTAEAQLALGADAALGAWTARLLEGGALKDDVAFSVGLPAAAPLVSTDRARYVAGEAVAVTASVRNDSGAALEGTSLVYSGATSRVRAGVDAAPGTTIADAFTFMLPADAAPGPRTLTLGWQLACGAAPFLTAAATFDVAPAPPAITAPAAGALVADATPTVSGTAVPGATVVVTLTDPLGDRTSPPLTADPTTGAWSWTVPDADALAEGAHSATATQTASGVPSASSAPVSFTVDTVPPGAPAISAPATGTISSVATVDVSGTAVDPEAVSVEILVDGTPIATVPVVAGAFSATVTLADGARSITARALDAAGNASAPSPAVSITVDTVAPAKPSLAVGVPSPTKAQPVPFTGTAEPLAYVDLLDGGVVIATVQAGANGAYSVSPSLGEGSHTLVARATDAAGNVGPASDPVSVAVDRTAPAVPLVAVPADLAVLGAAEAPAGAVAVSGTAEAGATVELTVSLVPYPGTVAAAGDVFHTTLTLADGSYLISARAVDAAGNASAWSVANAFTLDTAAPGQPLLASPADGASLRALTIRVEGQVDPGTVAVDLLEGGVVVETAAPAGGAVSFDLSRPEGLYVWTLVARDAAGNASLPSNSATVSVDRTAPSAAVVTVPAAGATVPASGGVAFSGTAEPGSTVAVSIDGGAPGIVTVAGDGTWSVTVPAADGDRTATVVVVDPAGNASAPVVRTFTADSIAPAAPSITSPPTGTATNAATIAVAGTAEDGVTVRILVNGVQVAALTASGGGFSATVPLPPGDGEAVITAVAVDAAGNVSPASSTVTVTVDRTPPAAPAFSVPSLTNLALVPVTGTAEPGATVQVLDGGVVVATTTALPDGTFSVDAPLGDGTRAVSVSVRDAAGNATTAGPATVEVDRAAPAVPVVLAPADGAVLGAADLVAGQVAFSGTAEPRALVELEVDGVAAGAVSADALGAWSVPATVAAGPHTVRARATDAAGNGSGLGTAVAFTVDVTLPAAPVLASPAGPLATRALDVLVAGTAEPGATIRIFLDGVLADEVAADGVGAFSTDVALPAADGTTQLTAIAVDAGGNASPPTAPVAILVDRAAPAAPAIAAPAAGGYLPSSSVVVSGTAEPLSTVRVTADSGQTAEVTAATDGTFQATLALPDGARSVTVRSTDAAGNSAEAARAFTVDTAAPAAPAIASPASGTATSAATVTLSGTAPADAVLVRILDGGAVVASGAPVAGAFAIPVTAAEGGHAYTAVAVDAAGNLSVPSGAVSVTVDRTAPAAPTLAAPASPTNAAQVTFTGTAEPGATVEIVAGGTVVGTGTADATTGAFSIPVALAEGALAASARARDAAGNVGAASGTVSVTVDRTAPAAPTLAAPASPTNAAQVIFTGTAEPGATVEVVVGGAVVGTGTADATGAFSIPVALPEGDQSVTARARDAAGNVGGDSAAVAVTADRTAPPAPTVAPPVAHPVNAAEIDVSGTAAPGTTVHLFVNGVEVATTTATADTGAFGAGVTLPATEGDALITATAEDAAGNVSAPSEPATVTVDRTAPAAPVVDAPAAGATFPPGDAEIRGHAEPGALVTVTVAGTTETTTAAGDGTWSVVVGVPAGPQTVSATATDVAGNTSAAGEVDVTAATDDGAGGGGCGCRSTGGATGPLALLALLALAPRRRRARS